MRHFKPYEGEKPYIFISYAHRDSKAVMETVDKLHDRGYRIWYDEGIEVGSEWPECIAGHLSAASLVIAFISDGYMLSDNCRREMHYALSKRIKTINIFLEPARMTPGMEMQIGNIFALMKYDMGEEQFYEKLYAAPLLNCPQLIKTEDEPSSEEEPVKQKKKNREKKKAAKPRRAKGSAGRKHGAGFWIGMSLGLLFLAAVISLGIVGHFTGLSERVMIQMSIPRFKPLPGDTAAEFESPVFERAAREYTGIDSGALTVADLSGITELYIVGGELCFDEESALGLMAGTLSGGEISSLGDIAYFNSLERLWLIAQPLSSLETMPDSAVEYLNLSGCRISSLEGIGRLTKLRELVTDGCPVAELGDIDHCLQLRRVSLLGSHISDFTVMKPLIRLTDFSVSDTSIDDIKTVLNMSSLTHVCLHGCDLRGRFFRAFDRERIIVSLELVDCELNSTVNLADFSSLTRLTLVRTGTDLNWEQLAELSSLQSVTVDESCYTAVRKALLNTDVKLEIVEYE